MKLERFEMERYQSTWEPRVSYNLAGSGIFPLTVGELVGERWMRDVLAGEPLGYGHTNGSPELRTAIARSYPGATADHVLVTNGTAEANFLVTCALCEAADAMVVMMPNYMQIPLLARSLGANVSPWWLHEGTRWAPDLDELQQLVSGRTKAIFVCNPNNPTGATLRPEEMAAVCSAADRVGAWIVADEVYQGAELDGPPTGSFWGRSPKVIITGGLSKAYGLPGLRIGWVVAPREFIETAWSYRDFTTIASNILADRLAREALSPEVRARLKVRARTILSEHLLLVRQWMVSLEGRVSAISPEAGGIIFVRYQLPVNSTAFATRLRDEHSVLVVPGDHFEMDGYVRIGFGAPAAVVGEGLRRTGTLLQAMDPGPWRPKMASPTS